MSKPNADLRIKLREKIIKLAAKVPSAHPHIGSCLSCIDILIQTLIYEMKSQDKFILSKGHASLALYVVLNHLRKISERDLNTYFKEGTEFGIHTPSTRPKNIPLATGSLGHGLSFAAGLSKGFKLQNRKKYTSWVYCLMSDGECNEGSVWEAAAFACRHRLNNLIVLIDKNKYQAFGKTRDILGDGASVVKWKAFGFNVLKCDGHNLREMANKFKEIRRLKNGKPNILICNTVRGKGIRAIENKLESNYTVIAGEMYKQALEDIRRP